MKFDLGITYKIKRKPKLNVMCVFIFTAHFQARLLPTTSVCWRAYL